MCIVFALKKKKNNNLKKMLLVSMAGVPNSMKAMIEEYEYEKVSCAERAVGAIVQIMDYCNRERTVATI